MTIRIVVNLRAHPGKGDEFFELWQPHGEACRQHRGCLQYELFRGFEDPDSMVLLEVWEDQDCYDEHWAKELLMPHDFVHLADPDPRGIEFYFDQAFYVLDERGDFVRNRGAS